jgi:hypothetical protein
MMKKQKKIRNCCTGPPNLKLQIETAGQNVPQAAALGASSQ